MNGNRPEFHARALIRLTDAPLCDTKVANDCARVDAAVARISVGPGHSDEDHVWIAAARNRFVHPLAAHAIARNGRPEYREGTSAIEIASCRSFAADLRDVIDSGDADAFSRWILLIARAIGSTRPEFRMAGAMLEPDGSGAIVRFANAAAIERRMGELHAYLRYSQAPRSFKALIAQAALLNLHPFEDGNGRVSRVLFNALLWSEAPPNKYYLPLYELRKHSPYAFEIALRSAELHDSWQALARFYADFVELYESSFVK